jgi:YHS domain-containing protein
MKKHTLSFAAMLVAMIAAVVYAEVKLEGVKCPLSGQPVKADKTVDYKGAKVYFCCENCPKSFDAEKHGTKANAQLVQTGQAKQKACPLSGGKLDDSTKIKVGDAEVAFCCNMCKGKVSKASADEALELVYSAKAFDKGFEIPKPEKK